MYWLLACDATRVKGQQNPGLIFGRAQGVTSVDAACERVLLAGPFIDRDQTVDNRSLCPFLLLTIRGHSTIIYELSCHQHNVCRLFRNVLPIGSSLCHHFKCICTNFCHCLCGKASPLNKQKFRSHIAKRFFLSIIICEGGNLVVKKWLISSSHLSSGAPCSIRPLSSKFIIHRYPGNLPRIWWHLLHSQ